MYSGVIYLATNLINGNKYVGQTNNFLRRKNEHKYSSNLTYFHRAIRKYGFNNFKWEILQIFCYSSTELLKRQLNNAEIKYIQLFDTLNNGYNLNEGGGSNTGFKHSEESKHKMSLKQSGRVLKDETKLKLRECRLGTKQTEQQKEKVSKRIIMTDINDTYICTWKSAMDAERNGNFDHSAIIKCCKNKQNYHKNFKFKYEQIN